jgi:CRP-like cAMP-binding protein
MCAAELSTLPLLACLSPPGQDRLLGPSTISSFRTGSFLFREGETPSHLHLLLSGLVELTKTQGRKECGLMIFSAGDLFMPAAALFDERYLASARVLAPSRILFLDLNAVREEAAHNPSFSMTLSRVLAGQWRAALRDILDLKCRSAPQRLAAFLLKLAAEDPDAAELPFSKRTLASRVGMSAETLSRALQTLADNGLLLRGNRIIVRDADRIANFCGRDPYPSGRDRLDVHLL